jgi:hypothetical protein
MNEKPKTGQWIGLFLLGGVLFNFPIMTLFNRSGMLLGIPLLYLYIFATWLALIIAIALLARTRHQKGPAPNPGDPSRPNA